jgi:acetyl-CoA carboxylase carboxyl transferase subunit alpha
MAAHVLPFEKSVVELVSRVRELRELASSDARLAPELKRLEEKAASCSRDVLQARAERRCSSRRPNRPYTLDYITRLFDDFVELPGDRRFADDAHRRWSGALSRPKCGDRPPEGSFDQGEHGAQLVPSPKARRQLASQAGRSLPPPYCSSATQRLPWHRARSVGSGGDRARHRGHGAHRVPVVTTVISELARRRWRSGIGNRVLILEFSYYSMISPRLRRDLVEGRLTGAARRRAFRSPRPTCSKLGCVDAIVDEPPGRTRTTTTPRAA